MSETFLADVWNLFAAFFRASNLSFGGGPAIIPLMQVEAVNHYQWMTSAQYSEAVAVTNALPGPAATKIAAYVGYQVASWPGVVASIAATILPTLFIVVFAGKLLVKYADSAGMKSMLKGVRPVVAVFVGTVGIQWGVDICWNGTALNDLWTIVGSALIGIATAIGFYFKIHPAILVVAAMGAGYLMF